MKLDTYTKVVLTGIAVFLGVIAFDYRPNMEAKAGIMGGGEMIMKWDEKTFIHMKDGKFKFCATEYYYDYDYDAIRLTEHRDGFICSPFSNGFSK